MKRASYRHAVEWIALNDNPSDDEGEADVAGYVTVTLVADLFGVEPARVARDIVRVRNREEATR